MFFCFRERVVAGVSHLWVRRGVRNKSLGVLCAVWSGLHTEWLTFDKQRRNSEGNPIVLGVVLEGGRVVARAKARRVTTCRVPAPRADCCLRYPGQDVDPGFLTGLHRSHESIKRLGFKSPPYQHGWV